MAETRPDPDRAVDHESIDLHARKLVAEKAARDRERFERLGRQPLSAAETLAVVLAVAAVVLVAGLALIPAGGGGSTSQRASGGVIQNGKYEIPQEKGLNTGSYRVEVHWLKTTGRELTDPMSGDKYDERKEALPAKFHTKSELTVTIPAPDNKHDLNLTSK